MSDFRFLKATPTLQKKVLRLKNNFEYIQRLMPQFGTLFEEIEALDHINKMVQLFAHLSANYRLSSTGFNTIEDSHRYSIRIQVKTLVSAILMQKLIEL